jgi:hypothetical protein
VDTGAQDLDDRGMTVKTNNININIEEVFGNLRQCRDEGIRRVGRADPSLDSTVAMLVYDFEVAPLTTNAAMLRMIGVDPSTTADSDDEAGTRIRSIIDGLAAWGVYLCGTNHLTDSDLLKAFANILSEEVRLVPPDGRSEFIDLANDDAPVICNRDSGLPRPPR